MCRISLPSFVSARKCVAGVSEGLCRPTLRVSAMAACDLGDWEVTEAALAPGDTQSPKVESAADVDSLIHDLRELSVHAEMVATKLQKVVGCPGKPNVSESADKDSRELPSGPVAQDMPVLEFGKYKGTRFDDALRNVQYVKWTLLNADKLKTASGREWVRFAGQHFKLERVVQTSVVVKPAT